MLDLIATGVATALGGPGAGAVVGTTAGSALSKIETNWFGGGARDDARQQRVNWFVEAAKEGSVMAGRVIIAAPQNVGSNEARQWQTGYQSAQAANPSVMAAALSQGPYWDSSDNATSDNMRRLVVSELASLGQPSPGSIPSTQNTPLPGIVNSVNRGIATGAQQAGASAGNGLANSIDPYGGYGSLTLNKNLVLFGIGAVVVAYVLHHHKA